MEEIMWKDIAFGFVLSADQAAFWQGNPFKAEQTLLERAGVTTPAWSDDQEERQRRSKSYIAGRDKVLAECGCKLMVCGNTVVAVSYEADQEDAKEFKYVRELDVAGLDAKGLESIPRLSAFCQMLGITFAEPQWLVVRQTARI
jgi:hypothetical protein